MFEVGELVVNGNRGVFRVETIGPLDMSNVSGDKMYYTLCSVRAQDQKVYIPVDSQKSSLRRVITKEETLELLRQLPKMHPLDVENERAREQKYKEAMDKHECEEWMKMVKTLYRRMQERRTRGKRVTSVDEKYMQIAKKCLIDEFAVSLGISVEEVETVLRKVISGQS
ncbi:MAG: CarD family transcriptional regulator [Blautia sp.]|jgi:CarD family transcriptional regulator